MCHNTANKNCIHFKDVIVFDTTILHNYVR